MSTSAKVLQFKRKRVSDREWLLRSFVLRPCRCYLNINSSKPSADMRCMKCGDSFRTRVTRLKKGSK